MPRTKAKVKDEEKIEIPKDFSVDDKDDEKINSDLILDDESLAIGDDLEEDDDEIDALDDDEVDPFKDKWEE